MSIHPKDPVTMSYQTHDSPIYSVNFSPFHRHLFLSCGHDGQMRIYSQLFVSELLLLSRFFSSFVIMISQTMAVALLRHKAQF